MAGDSDADAPSDFNDCVSQRQFQAEIKKAMEGLGETIQKAISAEIIKLNLGNQIERLDKRLSTLTDQVTTLETQGAASVVLTAKPGASPDPTPRSGGSKASKNGPNGSRGALCAPVRASQFSCKLTKK